MNAILVIFFISFFIYCMFNNIKFIIIYLSLIGLYSYFSQFVVFKNVINSVRRKIQIGTWEKSYEETLIHNENYSKVKVDITKIEPYLEKKSKEIGEKITLTTFAIKLMSIILKKYPEINGYINYGKVKNKYFFIKFFLFFY